MQLFCINRSGRLKIVTNAIVFMRRKLWFVNFLLAFFKNNLGIKNAFTLFGEEKV